MGLKEHIIELKGCVSSEPCFLQTGHWSIPFAESGLTSTVVTLYGLMHCILNLVERGNLRESLPALAVVCKKTMALFVIFLGKFIEFSFRPQGPCMKFSWQRQAGAEEGGSPAAGFAPPSEATSFS